MRTLALVAGVAMLIGACGGTELEGSFEPVDGKVTLTDPCTGMVIGVKDLVKQEYRFNSGEVVPDAQIDRSLVEEVSPQCQVPDHDVHDGVGTATYAATQTNGTVWIISECGRGGCASCAGGCVGDYCWEECDDVAF